MFGCGCVCGVARMVGFARVWVGAVWFTEKFPGFVYKYFVI